MPLPKFPGLPVPLDSIAAEIVIAPLHDPQIASQLGLTFEALEGRAAQGVQTWCWYAVSWEDSKADEAAARLTMPAYRPDPRFTELVLCLSAPESVRTTVEACVDGQWQTILCEGRGTSARTEFIVPLPGGELSALRMDFIPSSTGPKSVFAHWIGLRDPSLFADVQRGRIRWDAKWPGLVLPVDPAKAGPFAVDLMFNAEDLPALREKKSRAPWKEHFALLEKRAYRAMEKAPEDQLSDYAPFTDLRYIRQHEHGRWNYYHEGPVAAFVGLINQDPVLLEWAARTLMCMVHTTFWCQSAESRLQGSTWDQRCFVEEEMTSAVALMADWLDPMLTLRARDLIRNAIWDKGLAVIERDMMKCEYVHHMNQGPWFCRARILGGLLLEKSWPRTGQYVDRAVKQMREAMDRYVLPDGGPDEGLGYWSLTVHVVLQGLKAYSRSRNIDLKTLLPRHQNESENFIAILSAVEPGAVLVDGDNSTDYLVGDTIPILAGLYPGSVYEKIASACLLKERPFTYFNHYLPDGLFAFVLGPDQLPPAQTIVPTFGRLAHTGHLTSLREHDGRSVRLHLSGSKANPSHSHLDKSGFTLEIDGQPALIDRGIIRYDDPRGGIMRWSCFHNVITPVLPDGSFAKQATPGVAIIPEGTGDSNTSHARIDITETWKPLMTSCSRAIDSENAGKFVITDEGTLGAAGRVAFHLNASSPFEIDGHTALLKVGPATLRIVLDWSESVIQVQDGVDWDFKPVHHLIATSGSVKSFSFQTHITIET